MTLVEYTEYRETYNPFETALDKQYNALYDAVWNAYRNKIKQLIDSAEISPEALARDGLLHHIRAATYHSAAYALTGEPRYYISKAHTKTGEIFQTKYPDCVTEMFDRINAMDLSAAFDNIA